MFTQENLRYSKLTELRDRIVSDQVNAQNARRDVQASENWTPAQGLSWEQYCVQLTEELASVERLLEESDRQRQLLRAELQEADVAVKALEKLAERHHADQKRIQVTNDERDRDDLRRSRRAA